MPISSSAAKYASPHENPLTRPTSFCRASEGRKLARKFSPIANAKFAGI
jgi:hypothetical protein